MLDYQKARVLAQTWIDLQQTSVEVQIVDEATISKPYGWIFFYQSKRFLETENISDILVGNAPIFIDRFDGELRICGTSHPIEQYLTEYEKTISPMRLQMNPEFPPDNL